MARHLAARADMCAHQRREARQCGFIRPLREAGIAPSVEGLARQNLARHVEPLLDVRTLVAGGARIGPTQGTIAEPSRAVVAVELHLLGQGQREEAVAQGDDVVEFLRRDAVAAQIEEADIDARLAQCFGDGAALPQIVIPAAAGNERREIDHRQARQSLALARRPTMLVHDRAPCYPYRLGTLAKNLAQATGTGKWRGPARRRARPRRYAAPNPGARRQSRRAF